MKYLEALEVLDRGLKNMIWRWLLYAILIGIIVVSALFLMGKVN